MTRGLSSRQSSAFHLAPVITHKIHVDYSSSLTMSLRPSENTQIRLCKKCSATQHFLLKHGSKKCLVVIFTIAYKLNNPPDAGNPDLLPLFLLGEFKTSVSQESPRSIHSSAETFSLETFSLPPIDTPSVNEKRVKGFWAIERNNKSIQIYWVFWLVWDSKGVGLFVFRLGGYVKKIERLLKIKYYFQQL